MESVTRTLPITGDVKKDLTNLLKIYRIMPEFGNILLKAENAVVGFIESTNVIKIK